MPLPFSGLLRKTHKNIGRITELIKSYNPDIVGLIEVDSGSRRSAFQSQVQTIASQLGYTPTYNSKYDPKSILQNIPILNKQGNALLTRHSIQGTTHHFLSKGVKRLVTELELEDVTIFLVHLALTFRSRQWQLTQLHQLIDQIKKPVIVAGDLNVFWGESEIKLFLAATGLKNMNTKSLPTYPYQNPKRQLDFILHSASIRVTSFDVCTAVPYSDHLPLVCQFTID